MRRLLLSSTVVISLLLMACSGLPPAPPPAPPASLWHDDAFAPVDVALGPEQAMAVSEPMRQYLHREMASLLKHQGPIRGLVTALTEPGWLKLRYDASATRTAAQAFESRSGNCLSLVILTAALAHEMGLQVYFQEVLTDEVWSRQAGLYVSSGHVNVTLGRPMQGEWRGYDPYRQLTIDFLPPAEAQTLRTRPLTERTVLAMFMNNRAAEALADRDLDKAYAWARAAVLQDPAFHSAYNTLAVVYLRHGLARAAEASLRHLLDLAPAHTQGLNNLVLALRAQGRQTEAEATAATLRRLEKVAPFEFYNLGMAALKAGDAHTAREWFRKELDRDPDYHEFHFALAQAEWKLGHAEAAGKALAQAMSNSPQRATQDLYAAKLARLQAVSHSVQPKVQ